MELVCCFVFTPLINHQPSLLTARLQPGSPPPPRPAPACAWHCGYTHCMLVPCYTEVYFHPTPNISLASGHLALCAIGRTFYFRNIVFHLSTRPPNLRVARAPTSIFCRTFHNGLATLHNNHNILMSLKCLYLVLHCAVSNSPQLCCIFCYF